jgi:hypothetical protein
MSKYELIGKTITDGVVYLSIMDYDEMRKKWLCEDVETGDVYDNIETSDLLGFSVV